jgi:hypothetical protein
MFSGSTEKHIVAECYELGADYFIAKLRNWQNG